MDSMFGAECALKLFQQHQAMAQDEDFLPRIELCDDLARQDRLSRPSRCFEDKSPMFLNDRWKFIDDFLLPISKAHYFPIAETRR